MITLFENSDFRLLSTEHDYDFVGIIETKTERPLTFFFAETLTPSDEEDEDSEWVVCEDATELLDVRENLEEPVDDEDFDEAESIAERWMMMYDHVDWLRTRDDKYTGFLSDPKERGWFLALIKNYCSDRLKDIPWA